MLLCLLLCMSNNECCVSGPITSVEWHPSDSSVFGASGEDNQVSLWDLGVESAEATVINELEVCL